MNIKQVEDHFTISEQIAIEDIQVLAELGVKKLICNRPEGEQEGQLTSSELTLEAEKHGIEFIHIPSPGRDIPKDSLEQFIDFFKNNTDKTHAYCRTGTRSSLFWGLSKATEMSPHAVLELGKNKGINLEGILDQLEHVHSAYNQ